MRTLVQETPENQPSHNYCALPLVSWACRPDRSRGRLYPQPDSRYRTCFQRDRDRIVHSAAFRRLQYKTQVFVYHEGDHYRTRLTHTLEVAQIARTLARALSVNEDLAETVALAHDLGHTPFAHMGEDALDECMTDVGGYDHNEQSLRVLVLLERRYPGIQGLNLTWETLEGVVKHNGPLTGPVPETVATVQKQTDLLLSTHAPVEAQAAALADDIAYNNHDTEDGLRAGLFALKDIRQLSLPGTILKDIEKRHPGLDDYLLTANLIRDLIGAMVEDVLTQTQERIDSLAPESPDDIRNAGRPTVAFSESMLARVEELRAFLHERMYRHEHVNRTRDKVMRIVRELYALYMDKPDSLPPEWRTDSPDKKSRARNVADYIAGMTDRYAVREHERLFGTAWDIH